MLEFIYNGIDLIKIVFENYSHRKKYPIIGTAEAKIIVDTAHKLKKRVSAHVTHTWNLQRAIDSGIDDIAHMVVEVLSEEMALKIIEKGIYWIIL